MDTFSTLLNEYQYAALRDRGRKDVAELVKMAVAKHETGSKRPGSKLIGRVDESILGSPLNETDRNSE